jgi:outer membrane protein assembly factor BamB
MPIAINGTGTITGISAGGLPDACVTAADLASGAARSNFGAGCVLQVAQAVETSVQNSLTSSTFADLPNLSVAITPSSTNNKILVTASVYGSCNSNGTIRLMRDSTPIGLNTSGSSGLRIMGTSGDFYANANTTGETINITFLDSPSLQSSIVYKLQYAVNTGSTLCLNSSYLDANNSYTIRGISTITVMEIAG